MSFVQSSHTCYLTCGNNGLPTFCDTKVLVLVPKRRQRLANGGIIGVEGVGGVPWV
jgi:hypothetical protein